MEEKVAGSGIKIFPRNDDIDIDGACSFSTRRAILPERGDETVLSTVDVQQLFLQSTAVEKVQQMQQHQDMQQKYLAMQLTEERKLSQAKVTNAEEAERTLLRGREERRRQKKAASVQHASGESSSREDTETQSPEEGEYIDIRV
jgi:hypothetical protein